MNQKLQDMARRVREGTHRTLRQSQAPDVLTTCEDRHLSWLQRSAYLTHSLCDAEKAVIAPGERIVFTRTIPQVPPIYSPEDWATLTQGRTLHELGPISNICADWGMVLSQGLLGRKRAALATRARCQSDPQAVEFLDAALETIDATLALAARYAAEARRQGREDLAAVLDHVPANPPRTFHEALQALRLLHSVVWLGGHYHVGIGRFDQFMWSYLKADLDAGRLDIAGAEELLAEFFIALNKDSDLYPGVQQGDNGQTLTIGGITRDGQDGCNELTRMVLRVARDVAMIDPKINLRISSETDLDLLSLATELTRKGLGFPQYSNDDVVIPALIAHGYDVEDARNYTVAACWEFIIPGKGLDVVNIGAVSFPAAVDQAIREGLDHHETFEQILERTAAGVQAQTSNLVDSYSRLFIPPAPFYSVVMDGCLERGQDLSAGLKYNNFGIHGACGANAADALAAVQQFVFTDHSVEPGELLNALDTNYAGYERLRKKLQDEAPKVGKNSEQADALLVRLFDDLADACESLSGNGQGRVVRPGTGTAMYYIWLARGQDGMREPVVGATAEGRQQGDFFSANLSPSTGVRADGPFSVFQSFAKIDYRRICNGGPITLELSDSVFRDSESIRKVAMLVRTFAQLGCQQLQINSLNAATLIDAQAHPENHANLIVRVWGWSGYFCELAPEYQDHIITRQLYAEAG
jgi:formate C-acetyltransferase